MGRNKKPIALVVADGKKHLSKEEIRERMDSEIKPCTDDLEAPGYLTKKQVAEYNKIVEQLKKLKIVGETDVDAIARYVLSQELYLKAIKQLNSRAVQSDPYLLVKWANIQDKYFKQCRACANDLGLTITSRCKLVVPQSNEPPKRENKFSRFEKTV